MSILSTSSWSTKREDEENRREQERMRATALEREANEEVDHIFRKQPVQQIQAEAKKLKAEVEEKKEELRQLVGIRYRDLIDTADTIISMRSLCGELVSNIESITKRCESYSQIRLTDDFVAARLHQFRKEQEQFSKRQLSLSHIESLLEAQDQIFTCLELGMTYDAARMLVLAENTYSHLTLDSEANNTVRAMFLDGTMEKLKKLSAQIASHCESQLRSGHLSTFEYCQALCGLVLLKHYPPVDLAVEFLNIRKQAITSVLQHTRALKGSARFNFDSIIRTALDLLHLFQSTLILSYVLFVSTKRHFQDPTSNNRQQPVSLVYRFLSAPDEHANTLIAQSSVINNNSNSEFFTRGYERITQQRLKQRGAHTTPPAVLKAWRDIWSTNKLTEIKGLFSQFILDATDIMRECMTTLCEGIFSAKDIVALEDLVRHFVSQPEVITEFINVTSEEAGSNREPYDDDEFDYIDRNGDAKGNKAATNKLWQRICESISNTGHLDLWATCFSQPLLSRQKSLIVERFNSLTISHEVSMAMQTLAKSLQEPSTRVGNKDLYDIGSSVWGNLLLPEEQLFERYKQITKDVTTYANPYTIYDSTHLPASIKQHNGLQPQAKKSHSDISIISINVPVKGLTNEDTQICLTFYEQLKSIIEDLYVFIARERSEQQSSEDPESKNAGMLERTIYSAMFARFDAICEEINVERESISKQSANEGYNPLTIEKNLFLGRVCKTISDCIENVVQELQSASNANTASTRKRVKRKKNAGDNVMDPLHRIRNKFEELYISSHQQWLDHLSADFLSLLTQLVKNENWTSKKAFAEKKELLWEGITVNEEGEAGHEVQERIRLPSNASETVLMPLYRICEEINRVGGYAVQKSVIKKLASSIAAKVVDFYKDFVFGAERSMVDSRICEEGYIQILFDLKFMESFFFGQCNPGDAPSATELQYKQLMQDIRDQIDPINWAIFEDPFNENVARCCTKNSLLFASIRPTSTSQLPSRQGFAKSSTRKITRDSSEPNHSVLSLYEPVEHFNYLPLPQSATTMNSKRSSSTGNLDTTAAIASGKPQHSAAQDQYGAGVLHKSRSMMMTEENESVLSSFVGSVRLDRLWKRKEDEATSASSAASSTANRPWTWASNFLTKDNK